MNQMTWKAKVLGSCFLVHYLHRALLYPLQTRPSRPTPLLTFLCAYAFTSLNGLLQARTHHVMFMPPPRLQGCTPRCMQSPLAPCMIRACVHRRFKVLIAGVYVAALRALEPREQCYMGGRGAGVVGRCAACRLALLGACCRKSQFYIS